MHHNTLYGLRFCEPDKHIKQCNHHYSLGTRLPPPNFPLPRPLAVSASAPSLQWSWPDFCPDNSFPKSMRACFSTWLSAADTHPGSGSLVQGSRSLCATVIGHRLGTLGRFQIWAVLLKLLQTFTHRFLSEFRFSFHLEIFLLAGLLVCCIFLFIRNCQTIHQSGFIISHPNNIWKFFLLPVLTQHWVLSSFLLLVLCVC